MISSWDRLPDTIDGLYSGMIDNPDLKYCKAIDTIPVLVSKGPDTYSIIKGEKNILNYIRHTCFTSDDVIFLDRSISTDDEEISVFSEESGECSVTVDCAESEYPNWAADAWCRSGGLSTTFLTPFEQFINIDEIR